MFKKKGIFTETFQKYYPLVYSTISSKVENTDDADDICQEVFIALYKKFDSIENVRKWLYGTIRFEIINYYKKKKGSNVNIDELLNDVSLSYVNGFRDTRIMISDALEDSSTMKDDTDRDLVNLISVHRYTYDQAGDLLGLTNRQTRYRYGQVVNRIFDYMKKRGVKSIGDLL